VVSACSKLKVPADGFLLDLVHNAAVFWLVNTNKPSLGSSIALSMGEFKTQTGSCLNSHFQVLPFAFDKTVTRDC
jgi:hypothetical protein